MSPRPEVPKYVALYPADLRDQVLSVRPGITDPASIVFSDEGDVLHGSPQPDLLYNQIIRPWKSRLALLYIDQRSFWSDLQLVFLTAVAILSRENALKGVQAMLQRWGAEEALRYGVVNEVVPHEKLIERATELATIISEGAPLHVRAHKQYLRQSVQAPGSYGQNLIDLIMGPLQTADDTSEGTKAFLEKRDPHYKAK